MTVDAPSVGHRYGDGYTAGHRAEARTQGPAQGKAGDGAHASVAGDLLSQVQPMALAASAANARYANTRCTANSSPNPYCLKYRRELLQGVSGRGKRD